MPATADTRLEERLLVEQRRFLEARAAGLSPSQSRLFAEADTDIGLLRRLVEAGCPVELIAQIVL